MPNGGYRRSVPPATLQFHWTAHVPSIPSNAKRISFDTGNTTAPYSGRSAKPIPHKFTDFPSSAKRVSRDSI